MIGHACSGALLTNFSKRSHAQNEFIPLRRTALEMVEANPGLS